MGQVQSFLRNSDQHVSAHRNPNLGLHRVLAGAVEDLDSQVLLDPLEEQLHLPALGVQRCDQLRFENKVVGQKSNPFARLVFDHHTAQHRRIVLAGVEQRQDARLVANNICSGSVHRVGVAPLELRIALGARDKKTLGLVDGKQALEVQVPTVEQIERPCLDGQLVQRVDLVGLAIGDVDESGDRAPQVQQGVQPHRCLGTAKRGPRKHRQAQIDGRRIEGVDRGIQLDGQGLVGIQRTRYANQMLGQVGIDLPRACGVRIGQRVARNRGAAKTHVVQPCGLSAQIDLDVAQRLAVGQLGEGHGEELVQASEVLNFVVAAMIGYAAAKGTQGQMRHELRKHELALVHGGWGRLSAQSPESGIRCSNRDQTEMRYLASKSLTYGVLMGKRWDTTEKIQKIQKNEKFNSN